MQRRTAVRLMRSICTGRCWRDECCDTSLQSGVARWQVQWRGHAEDSASADLCWFSCGVCVRCQRGDLSSRRSCTVLAVTHGCTLAHVSRAGPLRSRRIANGSVADWALYAESDRWTGHTGKHGWDGTLSEQG